MNWDALAAIGELIGAIAVVATLGYLAIQIRHSHVAASDANRQSRAAAVREGVMHLVNNPDLRSTWTKAVLADGEAYKSLAEKVGLTPDEAQVLDMYIVYWVYVHWAQYHSTLTDYDREELRTIVGDFYSLEPFPTFLSESPLRTTMDANFLEFIEKTIESKKLDVHRKG